jgi:hypothetical protein
VKGDDVCNETMNTVSSVDLMESGSSSRDSTSTMDSSTTPQSHHGGGGHHHQHIFQSSAPAVFHPALHGGHLPGNPMVSKHSYCEIDIACEYTTIKDGCTRQVMIKVGSIHRNTFVN